MPVTLEGRETVGESEAWVLAVEPSGGERERHFIDTPASLPGGLSTVPRVVYKENDGIFGTGPTVTWPLPLPTSSRCSGNPVSDPWVGLPLG